jgi:hypothetical protein
MSPATATLNRIDPTTNAVASRITVATANPCPPFPAVCDELAVGDNAVWISLFPDNAVARVDPAAGKVAARIAVRPQPEGIATSPDAVWVVSRFGPTLSRIDPTTNEVVATVRLDPSAECCSTHMDVTASGRAVWVTLPDLNEVVRVNPATNKIAARIVINPFRWGHPCAFIVAGSKNVWAAGGHCAPSVTRINARTNKPTGRVRGFKAPLGVGLGFGSLWVVDLDAKALVRASIRSRRVVGRLFVGGSPARLAIGFGSIWVRDDNGRVLRFAPA